MGSERKGRYHLPFLHSPSMQPNVTLNSQINFKHIVVFNLIIA